LHAFANAMSENKSLRHGEAPRARLLRPPAFHASLRDATTDVLDKAHGRPNVAAIDGLEKGRKHGADLRPPCDVARPSAPGRTMEG